MAPTAIVTAEIDVGPFALLRVASVPVHVVNSMSMPATVTELSKLSVARRAAQDARHGAEDELRDLVRSVEDREARWDVIELRRDVHNGRSPRLDQGTVDRISARLRDLGGGSALRRWLAAQEDVERIHATGAAAHTREEELVLRPALWAALDCEWLRRGIAAASPGLWLELESSLAGTVSARKAARLDRSLLRYVLRGALKTSPFGTFLGVGVTTLGDGKESMPDLTNAQPVLERRVSRGLIARLAEFTSSYGLDHATPLLRNPSIRAHAGGWLVALVGTQVTLLDRPWRQERWAHFRLDHRIAGALMTLPDHCTLALLERAVGAVGLEPRHAKPLLDKLIERELFSPQPLLDAHVEDPLELLEGYVGDSRIPDSSRLQRELQAMNQVARATDDIPWHTARDAVRATGRKVVTAYGGTAYPSSSEVLFEELRLTGVSGGLGAGIRDLVSGVGEFLRNQVALRPEYLLIRDLFVEHYGRNGMCRDLVGFLAEVAARFQTNVGDEPLWKAYEVRGAVRPPPATRVGLTAFVQFVGSPSELQRGEGLVVANRVYEGVGWLSARYTGQDTNDARELTARLRAWLERSCAPAEPLGLSLSGHCNDLQRHARVTRRVASWAFEPLRPTSAPAVAAGDLAVRIDNSGLPQFFDPHDRPVLPVYLGSVAPVSTWGPSFWLTVLANPCRFLRPTPARSAGPDVEVMVRPRRTFGRVVLTRASWSVQSEELLRVLRPPGFERLVAISEFCDRHGIPHEFFVRQSGTHDLLVQPHRKSGKPMYIDTRNPLCLELLDRICRSAEEVSLIEVLPGPDSAWHVGERGRHTVEVQVEMVIQSSLGDPDRTSEMEL